MRSDQRANRHSRVQPEVLPTRKLQGESIFRIFGVSVKLRFIPPSRLALETFSYRARLSVGAYLAAVGNAEAVLFGGGIGEDSPWFREAVCAGLGGWGVELDITANRSTTGMSCYDRGLSVAHLGDAGRRGMQIAHECVQSFEKTRV